MIALILQLDEERTRTKNVEVIGRIIGIIGHRFRYEDEEKQREKWVQFNVLWRDQLTYLDYSEFFSFDLVSNFFKEQNDPTLSKKYVELKKARKVLGIMGDHQTLRWRTKRCAEKV